MPNFCAVTDAAYFNEGIFFAKNGPWRKIKRTEYGEKMVKDHPVFLEQYLKEILKSKLDRAQQETGSGVEARTEGGGGGGGQRGGGGDTDTNSHNADSDDFNIDADIEVDWSTDYSCMMDVQAAIRTFEEPIEKMLQSGDKRKVDEFRISTHTEGHATDILYDLEEWEKTPQLGDENTPRPKIAKIKTEIDIDIEKHAGRVKSEKKENKGNPEGKEGGIEKGDRMLPISAADVHSPRNGGNDSKAEENGVKRAKGVVEAISGNPSSATLAALESASEIASVSESNVSKLTSPISIPIPSAQPPQSSSTSSLTATASASVHLHCSTGTSVHSSPSSATSSPAFPSSSSLEDKNNGGGPCKANDKCARPCSLCSCLRCLCQYFEERELRALLALSKWDRMYTLLCASRCTAQLILVLP